MKVRQTLKERVVEDLISCVEKIEDINIREFVDNVLDEVPAEWWEVPASRSGRYHPPENNQECGTLIHTIKAFHVAEELFAFFGIEDSLDKDVVRAACILHDIWKSRWYDQHGTVAAEWLKKKQFDGPERVREQICSCVALHMSRWTYPTRTLARATTPNNLERIVQLADFVASRKSISFYPMSDICEASQKGEV